MNYKDATALALESGAGEPNSRKSSLASDLDSVQNAAMKSLAFLHWTIFCFVSTFHAQGQVPSLIHFQGRLAREQQAFKGAGEFKFSLVNSNGSVTFWSNDGTGQKGDEPSNAVPVLVHGGLFSVTLGDTALPNMTPVSPLVFTNTDVRLRIWFREVRRERKHDFEKIDRSEDDTDEPEGKRSRRRAFELLTPDQRITSVGYAMFAANVPDGAITAAKLANGAVTREKLAPDAFPPPVIKDGSILTRHLAESTVTTSKLADEAVIQSKLATASVGRRQLIDHAVGSNQLGAGAALANLMASGQSGVASGGMVLSFDGNSSTLTQAGYGRSGTITLTPERWENRTGLGTFNLQIAVWTGAEVIAICTDCDKGGRYDPRTDRWQTISTAPPWFGTFPMFVWSGSELIVWSGDRFNPGGAIYNPSTDRWRRMTLNGAPVGRTGATAVWTGTEMIVWGGEGGQSAEEAFNTGGRYDPARDEWLPIATGGSPHARSSHTAVWTGGEMIVWGGYVRSNGLVVFNSGGRYRPRTDSWISTPILGTPPPAANHTAIWSGTEMIVWGGYGENGTDIRTGGRFDPANNLWRSVTALNAPVGRQLHSAVWIGREMIVWGGSPSGSSDPFGNGGRYVPFTDEWFPLATDTAPSGRYWHHAFWLGDGMLIMGGQNVSSSGNAVMHLWRPAANAYLYQFQTK